MAVGGSAGGAIEVTVLPQEVAQGSYVVIRARPAGDADPTARQPVAVSAFGRRVPLFRDGAGWRGIAPVPLDARRGRSPVVVEAARRRGMGAATVRVTGRPFRLASRRVGLAISTDASRRLRDDRGEYLRALRSVTPVARWDGPLRRPVLGRISSPFGITRSYRGTAAWPHRGLDLAAPSGWPVVAAAAGRVVLSRYLDSYGNIVVLDHGQTIHTSYLHMTARVVRRGDEVLPGEVLGTIGQTGLATGPHLHLGTHVGVIAVDPEEMLRRGLP